MFHATLNNTKTWKQVVDTLATLLTEAHFHVSESGMTLCQLDSSRAAMVDLNLPATVFQEYECKGEHNISLGLDELSKVSKRMSGDEYLEFNLDEEGNQLEIKMVDRAEREFKLRLITPPENPISKPTLNFEVEAEMSVGIFKQVIKDMGAVSNHMKIGADKNTLTFSGEGDTGEALVTLTDAGDDPALISLKTNDGKPITMYALSYFIDISKSIPSDTMTLRFTENKPLMLEFVIAEAGAISFVLAPRVKRR